jgi:hypothetical protein
MPITSAYRVTSNTDESINRRIREQTQKSIAYFTAHPQQIDQRLHELDEEWDVERVLETASSCVSLFGLLMSIARGKKWLIVPLAVQGFFLQHAIQGWCPPLPVLRRIGIRTEQEIEEERSALRGIRGERSEARGQSSAKSAAETPRQSAGRTPANEL